MENTMSNEANALLQKLLLSRIDAAGAHCVGEPEPEEPDQPTPKNVGID
jgi:hypothetical protein